MAEIFASLLLGNILLLDIDINCQQINYQASKDIKPY